MLTTTLLCSSLTSRAGCPGGAATPKPGRSARLQATWFTRTHTLPDTLPIDSLPTHSSPALTVVSPLGKPLPASLRAFRTQAGKDTLWGPTFYSDTTGRSLPGQLVDFLGLPGGSMRISHVGFKPRVLAGIPTGRIVLQPDEQELAAVLITAKKPGYTVSGDRITLQLSNNSLFSGGSVLAALLTLPMLTENQANRTLSLEGKPITVALQDGRSLNLTAETLVNYLTSLPVGSIDRIEVITAPSARYEAAGGAVINLISVRPAGQGQQLSTHTALGWGRYGKANTSLTHALTGSALRLQTTYSFWYDDTFMRYVLNQAYASVPPESVSRPLAAGSETGRLVSNEYRRQRTAQHLLRSRLDYQLTKRLSAGLSVNGILNDEVNTPVADIRRQESALLEINASNTRQGITRRSLTLSGNAVYTFQAQPSQSLSLDVDYVGASQPTSTESYYSRQQDNSPVTTGSFLVQTPQQIRIMALKSDYSLVLGQPGGLTHRLETGFRVARSTFSQYPDLLRATGVLPVVGLEQAISIPFDYRESIVSGYVEDVPSSPWLTRRGLDVRLGLRYEQTGIETVQGRQELSQARRYANLFPNLKLTWTLARQQKLTLTANRRIARPTFLYLQPSALLLDPYTIFAGNPTLSPQYFTTLSAQFSTKTGSSLTLSYLYNQNRVIEVLLRDDPVQPVIYNTYINIDRDQRFSLNLTQPVVLSSSVRLQGTATAYYARFVNRAAEQPFENGQFSYQLQASAQWQLRSRFSLDALGRYQGVQIFGPLRYAPLGFLNAGAGYSFGKAGGNTGKLSLNVTDIFFTQRIQNGGNYASMNFQYDHRLESRRIMATFSWTLGNTKLKLLPDRTDTGSATEQERANLKR